MVESNILGWNPDLATYKLTLDILLNLSLCSYSHLKMGTIIVLIYILKIK